MDLLSRMCISCKYTCCLVTTLSMLPQNTLSCLHKPVSSGRVIGIPIRFREKTGDPDIRSEISDSLRINGLWGSGDQGGQLETFG